MSLNGPGSLDLCIVSLYPGPVVCQYTHVWLPAKTKVQLPAFTQVQLPAYKVQGPWAAGGLHSGAWAVGPIEETDLQYLKNPG